MSERRRSCFESGSHESAEGRKGEKAVSTGPSANSGSASEAGRKPGESPLAEFGCCARRTAVTCSVPSRVRYPGKARRRSLININSPHRQSWCLPQVSSSCEDPKPHQSVSAPVVMCSNGLARSPPECSIGPRVQLCLRSSIPLLPHPPSERALVSPVFSFQT
jgi:hypothetical protein